MSDNASSSPIFANSVLYHTIVLLSGALLEVSGLPCSSAGTISSFRLIPSSCRSQKSTSDYSSSRGLYLTTDLLGVAGFWRWVCWSLAGFLQPVRCRYQGAWPVFSAHGLYSFNLHSFCTMHCPRRSNEYM